MKKFPVFPGNLILLLALFFPAPNGVRSAPAESVTVVYTVNSPADANDGVCDSSNCTLREAINAANSPSNAGNTIEIYFDLDSPIILSWPLPPISASPAYVSITGPSRGATVRINGNGHGIFTVDAGASVMFQLLSLSGAYSTANGAALYNAGSVLLNKCTFLTNQSAAVGGAIYNLSSLMMYDSTLSYNQAVYGGAIYDSGTGTTLQVLNSTFDNNSATSMGTGGAIYHGSGSAYVTNSTFTLNSAPDGAALINDSGSLYLKNSTVVANQGQRVGPPSGGSLTNLSGSFHIRNSIVGFAMTGAPCYAAGGASFSNDGNNIDRTISCGFGSNLGSKSSTDPLLLPLANNGGPTQTMALQKTSPAVDGVTYNAPNECPLTDQRGFKRLADGNKDGIFRCDIGAFELQLQVFLPLIRR